MRTTLRHRRRDGGMLLGIVLILLGVVLLAGALAISSVRSDTASAGADRLVRQLQDCAEQGLEYGKTYFSSIDTVSGPYLASSNNCSSTYGLNTACYPNGPLHYSTGTPPTNYPFQQTVAMAGQSLQWTVALYDDDDETACTGVQCTGTQDYTSDSNGIVIVYSRCQDLTTHQSKAVQAAIRVVVPTNVDYAGQAGFGFRNQGNQN